MEMIKLFNINNYVLDTSKYENILHDKIILEFENEIKNYVGAKYAVSFNSATSAIFLCLLNKNIKIKIPTIIPPVVINAIITSGNDYEFVDNINWVGGSYILYDFGEYKIIDSAQKLEKNQFINECNDNDLLIFSFYPTKPIGSCDGGMIVSNDFNKIKYLKELSFNGMTFSNNNWDRKIIFPGYKMYMNSLQAEIGLNNFKKYESKINKLSFIRNMYNYELEYNNTSNHLYRININNRNKFIEYMKNNNIICGIHYESLHLNEIYKKNNISYPLSEEISKKTVSIPFHEEMNLDEIIYIINKIKIFNNENN